MEMWLRPLIEEMIQKEYMDGELYEKVVDITKGQFD
jgi:hypothetical protein